MAKPKINEITEATKHTPVKKKAEELDEITRLKAELAEVKKKFGGRPKIDEQATVRIAFYITPTQAKLIKGSRGTIAKKVLLDYLEGVK